MPDLTPADELRAASARLKYLLHPDGMPEQIRANWTQLEPPEKQGVITVPGEERPVLMAFWGGISECLVAVQPSVGEALADWLDDAADGDCEGEINPHALATARAILAGGTS